MQTIDDRKKIASTIQEKPEDFKICESCGSIVMIKANVCPNCHGYRFNPDLRKVVEQATILSKREPMSIDASDYL